MSVFVLVALLWLSTGAAIEFFARCSEERAKWRGYPDD